MLGDYADVGELEDASREAEERTSPRCARFAARAEAVDATVLDDAAADHPRRC